MELWDTLVEYFSADPLRVLTLLGGSGGLVYWVDRFRNRPRLKLKLVSERFHDDSTPARLEFEAMNLGNEPTSLEPTIRLTGYTPKRRRRTFEFSIKSLDRQLPAHAPKHFAAEAPQAAALAFLWFKAYRVRTTRGRGAKMRVRTLDHVELPRLRFLGELTLFRLLGKTSASVRSHGPLE
jgi:hypothetical protein